MAPITASTPTPAPRSLPWLLALVAALSADLLPARQFEAPSREGAAAEIPWEEPTVEGILEALRSGKPPSAIVAWIEESGTAFELDLEEVIRLRAGGVPAEIVAAMARMPDEKLRSVLPEERDLPAPPSAPRSGLSKRRLLKMIRSGVPEAEILDAVARQGSKASLRLDEAVALREGGASPALLAAIVTGVVPSATQGAPAPAAAPGVAAGAAAPAASAAAPAANAEDALPAGEETEDEGPLLDEFVDDVEAERDEEFPEESGPPEEAPLLEELLEAEQEGPARPGEGALSQVTVLSDPPGARVFVAPASARMGDLLRTARPAGRTPARLRLDPGAYLVLVEKRADGFDAEIVPALRTVHDGDGRTRTLIVDGDLYYDVERCCLPGSLSGDLVVSRVSEGRPGAFLGDEFGGLPPYLWDGNRYLVLGVRDGRIQRVVKIYEMRKSAGETRTLVASFVPSSADLLALDPRVPEGRIAEEAAALWEPPEPAELEGLARIYGIPRADLDRLGPLLAASGKAHWRGEAADGGVTFLTLSLDAHGQLRLDEVHLRRDGPYGMLSTPAPPPPPKKKKGKKAEPAPVPPPPLASPVRRADPGVDLPVLEVENAAKSAAAVRLGDGTLVYVGPGEVREVTVGAGTLEVEARFEDRPLERRGVRAHFTYHARYRLRLS
jgi:hypothetical protein